MWRETTIEAGAKNVWQCGIRATEDHQRQVGTDSSAIFSRLGAKVEGDRLCGPWLTLIEGEGDGARCLIMSGTVADDWPDENGSHWDKVETCTWYVLFSVWVIRNTPVGTEYIHLNSTGKDRNKPFEGPSRIDLHETRAVSGEYDQSQK